MFFHLAWVQASSGPVLSGFHLLFNIFDSFDLRGLRVHFFPENTSFTFDMSNGVILMSWGALGVKLLFFQRYFKSYEKQFEDRRSQLSVFFYSEKIWRQGFDDGRLQDPLFFQSAKESRKRINALDAGWVLFAVFWLHFKGNANYVWCRSRLHLFVVSVFFSGPGFDSSALV